MLKSSKSEDGPNSVDASINRHVVSHSARALKHIECTTSSSACFQLSKLHMSKNAQKHEMDGAKVTCRSKCSARVWDARK